MNGVQRSKHGTLVRGRAGGLVFGLAFSSAPPLLIGGCNWRGLVFRHLDNDTKSHYAECIASRRYQRQNTGQKNMPALGSRQPITITYLDHSGEVKTIRMFANEITAVSLPGFLADFGDLQTALDAVTLGVRHKQTWGEETIVSNTKPTDKQAQIETEMLVRLRGATSEAPWSFRIPTVDYDAFNYADPPAGDSVIISGAGATAATIALVDAIEALVKMPDDEAEAVVVVGMEVVR